MGPPEGLPTSFTLPKKDVDKLREAASEILDAHPEYQQLLQEMQKTNSGETE